MGKVVQFRRPAAAPDAPLKSEKAAVLAEFQETKRQIRELRARAKLLFDRYVELTRPARRITRIGGVVWAANLALLLVLALQASG